MLKNQTLYKRWLNTLGSKKNQTAVTDFKTDKRWTFSEIDKLLDQKPSVKAAISANAGGIELIVSALWAWREQVPLILLDENVLLNPTQLEGIPEGVAHIKHTSGTTGTPKLLLFSDQQIQADGDQIVSSMGLKRYDGNIGVISPVHSYGFSNLVLPLLLYGIPLIMCESPLPENLRIAFTKIKGKMILPAVPAMWNAWERAGVLQDAPVKLAISAGAPLSKDLEQRIYDSSKIKVHNFYGSSECGGITYDSSNTVRKSSRITGTPISGVELEITPKGRLLVTSEASAISYWPEDRGEQLGSGRYLTGDLAEIDASSNELLLIGRISEEINIAGRKLSPVDVEKAVMSIAEIECCVVFGIPSSTSDRVDDIVVCYRTSDVISEADLHERLKKKLPSWQLPRGYWKRSDLKINKLGKISRSNWRERYLSAH